MPRPSRNLDQALLVAGRHLFPGRGCAGLSVREVAESAGVNLGMFHYHFKSRDAFLRAVMQQAYEELFATLTIRIVRGADPVENLGAAMRAVGRFARDNRAFFARLLADALAGEACVRDFMRDNFPRHLAIFQGLLAEAQKRGMVVDLPIPQLMATCAGALALPILAGGAIAESGLVEPSLAKGLERTLLSDEAIDQRVDLALRAIAAGRPATRARKRVRHP